MIWIMSFFSLHSPFERQPLFQLRVVTVHTHPSDSLEEATVLETDIQILVLPLTNCVTLGNNFNLSTFTRRN